MTTALDFAARVIHSSFDRVQLALALERGDCICWACPKHPDGAHQAPAAQGRDNTMAEDTIDDAIMVLEQVLDELREIQDRRRVSRPNAGNPPALGTGIPTKGEVAQ